MRAKQISCAFTGHRPGKLPWKEQENDIRCLHLRRHIAAAVEMAVADGMEHFLCGMAEGCDMYFCEIVLALRRKYPQITIEAVIPCLTQADRWSLSQRQRYERLRSACDYETVIQQQYTYDCMQRRNRYLVDHASMLIAANNGTAGGTQNTIQYALRRGVNVVDVPIEE